MWQSEREKEGRGGLGRLGRPVTWLAAREEQLGLLGGQVRKPSGPAKERQQRAFGPKAEKKEDFYFLFLF
jgi:hypothetical protein